MKSGLSKISNHL